MTSRAERVRSMMETYAREGVEGALSAFDPDITWVAPPDWMDQPFYCGHEGLRQLDALWKEYFDDFGLTVEEIREAGDRVIVLFLQHGLIRGTGERVEQRAAWVMEYGENDLVVRVSGFFSWEEALAAAQAS